jgi:hypothetical protein
MSCESLFRPAGVSPPFFCAGLPTPVRFLFATALSSQRQFLRELAVTFLAGRPWTLNAMERCRGVK